jgi:glycolate oxidase FAD binding subunit
MEFAAVKCAFANCPILLDNGIGSLIKSAMDAIAQTLETVVGSAGVQRWESVEGAQQEKIAAAVRGAMPECIVYPQTQTELAAVMQEAQRSQWRVLPCGAGSKLDWGGLVEGIQLVVSTARLNQLIDHAIGDLTVTAEAGMSFAALQAELGQAGQFLAIDPAFPDQATLGGIIATGDSGSLRHRYNSVRDMVLGISFVRSDGEMVKAGGRVVKNVAGYDLMKLLTGSYGTLGILTQVTFRVYPLPQTAQTVVLTGTSEQMAIAVQSILSSTLAPSAIDLLSSPELALRISFQGIPESVELQTARLKELGLSITSEQPNLKNQAIVCKIGVKSSQAIDLLTQLETLLPKAQVVIHAGSGLGTLSVAEARTTQILAVRSLLESTGGFLSVLQAPKAFKQQLDVWGYSGNALALMKRIKHQFDAQNLLSPHRFVGGI